MATDACCESGAFERAARTVESAKRLAEGVDAPILAATHFYAFRAQVALPWGVGSAFASNARALAVARQHDLLRYEGVALNNQCVLHFMRGETDAARASGRRALLLSNAVASPVDLVTLLLNLARVETSNHNAAVALDHLAQAKHRVAADSPLYGMIAAAEAEALCALGRFDRAAPFAREAQRVFERCGDTKRMSIALRAQAEVSAGLGKQRAARTAIYDAVAAVERVSSAYTRAHVYSTSARIAGNARHADYAAQIRSALRS
jgi:tetratricopeptide (TPR) repeat protein